MTKYDITSQHIAEVSLCCEVISFVIGLFAGLVLRQNLQDSGSLRGIRGRETKACRSVLEEFFTGH